MFGIYFVYVIEGRRISRRNFGEIIFYTGMTGNLRRRMAEHFHKYNSRYMKNNRIEPTKLVYYETVEGINENDSYYNALRREKVIKRMPKHSKLKLIEDFQRKLRGDGFERGSDKFIDLQRIWNQRFGG